MSGSENKGRKQAPGRCSRAIRASGFFLLSLSFGTELAAEPYIPASSNQVILTLPDSVDSLAAIQRNSGRSDDAVSRLDRAEEFLELAYKNNDPRGFGYARAQLSPWWDQADPPLRAAVMKAAIEQHNHDFGAAIATLGAVLERFPRHVQARLMRAQVYITTARYTAATADCRALALLSSSAIAANCLAQVDALTGKAEESFSLLDQMSSYQSYISQPELLELKITLATIAHRLDRKDAAESLYREAMTLDPGNAYLLTRYCDFKFEQGEPGAVISLLQALPVEQLSLGQEVRLLEALQANGDQRAASLRETLAEKFDLAMARADAMPHKEYARFALNTLHTPAEALHHAQENWQYQKEPGDALLLLQSARASGDGKTIQRVADWIQSTGLQDHRIQNLLETLTP